MDGVWLAVLTEVYEGDIHSKEHGIIMIDFVIEHETGVFDLFEICFNFKQFSKACGFDVVGLDLFDGKVAVVSGG